MFAGESSVEGGEREETRAGTAGDTRDGVAEEDGREGLVEELDGG